MRQRDINRKAFSAVHYNIIAGRFKQALEPKIQYIDNPDVYEVGGVNTDIVNRYRAEANAIVDLAISMAKRFAMDN